MELNTALTGARALIEVAKGALAARDDAKVKDALIGMQEKLYDATSAALSSAEKASELQTALVAAQREVGRLEAKLEDQQKFRLAPIGKNGFAFTAGAQDGEHPQKRAVYYCQGCFDKGVRSILRYQERVEWIGEHWACVENAKHNIYC